MGSLKPGATYIYERSDGIVYAREFGSDPSTREEIGYNYDTRTKSGRPLIDELRENKLWGEIFRESETNPLLKEALDRVKILYELSKKDGKK